MVTEDSDKMFYEMKKKEKTLSQMLQEGIVTGKRLLG
jgi:hypothetical protein